MRMFSRNSGSPFLFSLFSVIHSQQAGKYNYPVLIQTPLKTSTLPQQIRQLKIFLPPRSPCAYSFFARTISNIVKKEWGLRPKDADRFVSLQKILVVLFVSRGFTRFYHLQTFTFLSAHVVLVYTVFLHHDYTLPVTIFFLPHAASMVIP